MPPCTEEIHLSLKQITLFVGTVEILLHVLQTEIALAYAVPRVWIERVVKRVLRGRDIAAVEPTETICPCAVVAEVHLVGHTVVSLRIKHLIVAPVPCRTPVTFLLVRNTVVNFLYVALEVLEVLEGLVFSHIGVWSLVKIRLAGSETYNDTRKEHSTKESLYYIINVFHCLNVRNRV